MDMTRPFVWTASKRDNFVYDCQQMRKRVEDLIPNPLKDREIKLGRGGLRDVEFTVQMLQLVHGRSDEALRTSSTLESLQALAEGGYVSRKQAKKLSWDYRFERVMEHRQQMWALKRTHLFPDLGKANAGGLERKRDITIDELNQNPELRRLARAFHMHPEELVNKYGGFILAVVIAGLAFAVGYEKVGEWRVSKAEQSNIRYVQAVTPGTDYENNIAELESIVNTESGLYKDIARLQIANILLDNNQTTKALGVLSKIYQDNTVSEKIREIAAVKLATYKIDSAPYAEIESMLGPIVRKGGAWAPMAKELLAMSAIQNKDMAKAKALYEELLAGGNISEEFRARINDMLASINEAQQDRNKN